MPGPPIGERALSKLRWRCRRGLLENDLFLARFFTEYADTLDHSQMEGLLLLMDLSDNDLLDLLLRRQEPQGDLLQEHIVSVLNQMRNAPLV
jgi:antitoxin CptB